MTKSLTEEPLSVSINCADCILNPLEKCHAHFGQLNAHLRRETRRLRTELAAAAEKERRVIAADLHDSLGQRLFAWQLRIGMALKSTEPESMRKCLLPVSVELNDAIKQVRTLVFELSPPILFDLGLSAALKEVVHRADALSCLRVKFVEKGAPRPLPDVTSSLLYRSAGELICNASKHSDGTKATLTVTWQPTRIQLTVADDGKGFDMDVTRCPVGLGLFNIRDRIQAIQGQLDISTAPGQGLTAVLDVPIASEE